MLDSNNTCEYCGQKLIKGKCPKCVQLCPFCNEVLGEFTFGFYNIGNCEHLIGFFDFFNNVMYWINEEYETRFNKIIQEFPSENASIQIRGEYVLPLFSFKDKLDYFAQLEGIKVIEHKDIEEASRKLSTFFYIIEKTTK